MKKIAILGTVPASKIYAPFDDPEWDIWVCSPGNRGTVSRVTLWFELHGVVDMSGKENDAWAPEYFKWLRAQTFPVMMQEPNELVPQAQVFPYKELLKEFGTIGRIAFTSSISWMIALAIHRGATEIGIFGVDMAATEEAYSNQKAGCQIMMALAHERGIKVTVPLESCLAQLPPLYGYAEATRMGRRLLIREQEMKDHIANYDKTLQRLQQERAYFAGALEDVQYMRRTFVSGEDAEIDQPTQLSTEADGYHVTALGDAALAKMQTSEQPQEFRILDPGFDAPFVPKPNGHAGGEAVSVAPNKRTRKPRQPEARR